MIFLENMKSQILSKSFLNSKFDQKSLINNQPADCETVIFLNPLQYAILNEVRTR